MSIGAVRASATALLVAILWAPEPVWAQGISTGSIAGVVRDTTGAVLPGVTVEAASPALIEKVRSVVTDSDGQYKIVDLRPGVFSVTFSLTGFSTMKREGIELTSGFTATVNGDLRVGALEETITVSGSSPVVDTHSARSQRVLSREVLDTLPANKTITGYAALTLGATLGTGAGAVQDVGGNNTDTVTAIAVHGSRFGDSKLLLDGMDTNFAINSAGGSNRIFQTNEIFLQEVVVGTGGISAESETAGVQVNNVPRDGGNTFHGLLQGAYTDDSFQADNLDDELVARGLSAAAQVRKVYNGGFGVGGPIKRDRLWFYTANRWWGSQNYAPGNYFNATLHTLFYTPDLNRPAYNRNYSQDNSLRLTWQAAQKHKITANLSYQHTCNCYFFIGSSTPAAPEAGLEAANPNGKLAQGTWSYPATNKLLFQAGVTAAYAPSAKPRAPGSLPTDTPVRELSTNYAYGAPAFNLTTTDIGIVQGNFQNSRFSELYVTGSHALKVGFYDYIGWTYRHNEINETPGVGPVSYQFSNRVPRTVIYYASPVEAKYRGVNLAFYAQDEWTMRRLTLNLGVRYDRNHQWNPEQTGAAGYFVPAVHAEEAEASSWHDINPRLGMAFDLFGNGKTAVKAFLGRYVQGDMTSMASATNKIDAIVKTASRTWTDANGDYFPQASELGPLSNSRFGTVVPGQTYDPALLTGWRVRPSEWDAQASIQHELRPGVGLTGTYFRRMYGGFRATQNTSVTAADFDPFCITAPKDTRLPGGGGYQLCGMHDIKPTAYGRVNSLVTEAESFGEQREVYDGFDLSSTARFGAGGLLAGGVSMGRTLFDNCYAKDRPDLTTTGSGTLTEPTQALYCKQVNSTQTQFKIQGAYPLGWGLQLSGVLQNLPGPMIQANYNATNAEIAPSLGRNLGQCGVQSVCNAFVTIPLIEPFTEFEDRITQLDLRLTRTFRAGRARINPQFELYNVFNANSILASNVAYGSTWLRPLQLVGARLFKFSVQVDF